MRDTVGIRSAQLRGEVAACSRAAFQQLAGDTGTSTNSLLGIPAMPSTSTKPCCDTRERVGAVDEHVGQLDDGAFKHVLNLTVANQRGTRAVRGVALRDYDVSRVRERKPIDK